jgi:hypothetical protein
MRVAVCEPNGYPPGILEMGAYGHGSVHIVSSPSGERTSWEMCMDEERPGEEFKMLLGPISGLQLQKVPDPWLLELFVE